MSPQLTLQTPLELPPSEVPGYLEQLWSQDQPATQGAHTFCLLVWQPAWVEQTLVRAGKVHGPLTGVQRDDVIAAARQVVADCDLPLGTPPLGAGISDALTNLGGNHPVDDMRGQHVDAAISALRPRRFITLAPSLDSSQKLETLVAAYCPLPEEGGGTAACGDVVVLRGGYAALKQGLTILQPLLPEDLPFWVWWNGSLDEAPELLQHLAVHPRRLILDSAVGEPMHCLNLLRDRIEAGQSVNDLNWLRLRGWRETLAMVFDPPQRRDALNHVVQLDLDMEGEHPVQGLLLAAWIADRLGWTLNSHRNEADHSITANFSRSDGAVVKFRLAGVAMGQPSIHPGQIVGLRLICQPEHQPAACVILCSESGGCMRLEAGGMASMELIEEVVSVQHSPVEADVARLLEGGHDTTNPLLAAAAPLAAKLMH
ncbi:MAG: glucose-6-phosphate dehydrogenase assembly protein OpcA [Synechococcus sp.]